MNLDELPLPFARAVVVVFGLLWGSFLNVVIYRVPRGLSVAFPPSTCLCGTRIKAYDNIPVVSYLLLGGRARCCGARISPRYPVVELLGAGLSLAIFEVLVRGLPAEPSLARAAAVYAVDLALALGLLAAAFIDAQFMYLPDAITLGGAALGVATATLRGMTFTSSLLGAFLGFMGIWLPFIQIYKRVRGRAGMGLGDAKLVALAGAWFGATGALFVVLAGAVQGTVGAGIIYAVRGKIEEPEAVRADREELEKAGAAGDTEALAILAADPLGKPQGDGFGQARMPFGPFLILACLEFLLAGEWILHAYESLFPTEF